ncbi:siphovirus ReqiPepy6 Gp37-like family protein [Clostridium tertium]
MDTNFNIRVFDKDINFLGEVDNFTSLFFIRKWETYGEFEFHLSNIENKFIKKGNIIMLNKDGSKAGVIEHIEINEEDTEDIVIRGFSLLYWLTNRVTVPPEGYSYHEFNTNVENIMIALVQANAINPTDTNRKIPGLILVESKGRGEKIQFQTRYKNLSDELTKLSKLSGLGITIDLDYKQKKFVFKVLEGKNLSYGQANNPPYIFSLDYDNIKKQNYIESDIGYKNVGYVAGQGEGSDRAIEILGNERSGFDRREVFIDARDIDENGSLTDRGRVKLSELQQIQSFECEVDTKDYKVIWNLGDIITTIDKKRGLRADNRISEIREVYENSGIKVEPTFGTPIPGLADKIKQMTDTLTESGSLSGGGDKSYEFNQLSPKKIWNIPHGLNKRPSVTIVDSGGTEVKGDVKYDDNNNATISFTAAFAGIAYLN